jgi:hypothetical protein
MLNNPNGYNPFGRTPGGENVGKSGFKTSQMGTLVDKNNEVLGIMGKATKEGGLTRIGLDPLHTGAITGNFPGAGINQLVPDWMYANLFGTCHQATNATLIAGGISSTVWNLTPHWTTFTTTIIYGNYGGALTSRIYSGIEAGQKYDKNHD